MNSDTVNPIHKAKAIALEALQLNTVTLFAKDKDHQQQFLLAGSRQYKSLWARDFAFASLGAIHFGFEAVIRDSLHALFALQRNDGLLPRGIDRHNVYRRVLAGLLGHRLDWGRPFSAWYVTENGVICLDSNLLLPWVAGRYIQHTGDRVSAEAWFPIVEKAVEFVARHYVVDGLVSKQAPFSDWADSVARTGCVAITNVFYILAMQSLKEWSKLLGNQEVYEKYSVREKSSLARFRKVFWQPKLGLLQNFSGDSHVTADANLFAVAFKMMSFEESGQILSALKKTPLWDPMPGRPTWPDYPNALKSRAVKWANLSDYHDRLYWIWISSLAAYAEAEVGNMASYQEIIQRISKQIQADGAVHEVYDLYQGRLRPLVRTLYRAEAPFSWSAGMFLWAMQRGTAGSP